MTAEAPIKTVEKFSRSWSSLNQHQLIAEFESVSSETNRKPDVYCFEISESKLVDPNTQKPVENFVGGTIEKDVFLKLQEWAISNDEGAGLWISPPSEGIYPCAKVIISKIAYDFSGKKYILNSAITLDTNSIYNPEYKRGCFYKFADTEENVLKIVMWIEKKSNKKIENIDREQVHQMAIYYSTLYYQGYGVDYITNHMQETGFLGENSISCPSSNNSIISSKFSYTESFVGGDQYGELAFSCPVCGATNIRPFGQLISNCQSCGGNVRC